VSDGILLAVDGGNSKTDLALLTSAGEVLALVRGPLSSPHHLGLDGALDVLEHLLEEAARDAGITMNGDPVAEVGALLLAGADLPEEELELQRRIELRGWARTSLVGNDTYAVLRAGTDDGLGVGVVCGAGINATGVTADGRTVRFPALGSITGDWGGGYDLGMEALGAAARSEDRRGPKTILEQLVPEHYGCASVQEVGEAIHKGQIAVDRVMELSPIVLDVGTQDDVACAMVQRLAHEVVAMVRACLLRLDLLTEPVPVALGGGVLQSRTPLLLGTIEAELLALNPHLDIRITNSRPIVGAALHALDTLGGHGDAQERLRRELDAAAEKVEVREVPFAPIGISVNGGVHGRASSGRSDGNG
jgi:N-acetylglucosamine kinase-like BadF-type ATPase